MYKLSPSDFRYLYEDCKHCYYQKVKYNINLPSIGIPGVFSKMNTLLKNSLIGKDLKEINSQLPQGKIEVAEGYLRSKLITGTDCYISGRFDFLSKLSDGTYSVIDFKISDTNEEKIQKFANQVHAYKFALENPAGDEIPKNISKMGLVVISPESIDFPEEDVIFKAIPKWFEISENMQSFNGFIKGVFDLLNGPPPKPNPYCAWCKYRLCFSGENSTGQFSEDIPF